MPIKGVSEILRMPRVGKIRLGVKDISERTGREYPKAVDFFVVTDDDDGVTSPAAAAAFRKVYGDKPRELDVMFPTNEPEQFFPQYLKRYGSGSGLLCKGDGEQAQQVDKETGELIEIVCNPDDCPAYNADPPQCRRVGTLQFLLPHVQGLGIWQIDTTSFYSIVNLNSALRFIGHLTGGRVAMIPLKLRIRPQEVAPGGRKKVVYVMDLACERLRLQDVLTAAQQPAAAALLPPLDESKAPDDLYARSVREGAQDVVEAEAQVKGEPEEPELPEDIARGLEILGWTEAKVHNTLIRFGADLDGLRRHLSAEVDRISAGPAEASASGRSRARSGRVTAMPSRKTEPKAEEAKPKPARPFF